jgi:peptide/nickel transport system substrate-binding protein
MMFPLFGSLNMRRSLIPLGLAIALCGCDAGGDRQPTSGEAGGTLVIASAGDADILFPALTFSQMGRAVSDVVFDKLAEIGLDLNTIGDQGFSPRLARSWEWARDSLSIVFHLDPRARWHDGRPVRASDVKYSFNLVRDPALGSHFAPLVANIDSIAVRDSLTAVAWFRERRPEQFYDLVYQVSIVPEHVYGAVPPARLRESELTRRPVGSGRFKFVRWEPGVRLEIAADTANYRGRAKLDRVIWTISPDPTAGVTKVLSGQADMWENLLPEHLPRFTTAGLRVQPYPGLQHVAMGMNLRDGASTRPHLIFGDVAVRRCGGV